MAYEKPNIIDLSSRSEKGFGEEGCGDGSGEAVNCYNGPTAEQGCNVGGIFTGGSSKYED